jgi:hypothetical protein
VRLTASDVVAIKTYLAKHPDLKPANLREFLIYLLDLVVNTPLATVSNTEELTALKADLQQEINNSLSKDSIIGLLNDDVELTKKENTRLQTELAAAKNTQAPVSADYEAQIMEILLQVQKQLAELRPSFFKADDKDVIIGLERIDFILNQKSEKIVELTTALDKSKAAAQLKPNQTVVNFNPDQIKAIGLARKRLIKLGYTFGTDNPDEVIHAVIAAYNESTALMLELLKEFKPLID